MSKQRQKAERQPLTQEEIDKRESDDLREMIVAWQGRIDENPDDVNLIGACIEEMEQLEQLEGASTDGAFTYTVSDLRSMLDGNLKKTEARRNLNMKLEESGRKKRLDSRKKLDAKRKEASI